MSREILLLFGSLFILLYGCKKEESPPIFNDSIEYGTLIDTRDSHTYKTIQINNQLWMAENLVYKCSGHNADDCESSCVYGMLYSDWKLNEVCPSNWHIPTLEEWQELIDFLGGKEVAGGKLKERGTTHWNAPNTDACNSSGFSAIPAGSFDYNSGPFGRNEFAAFWIANNDYGYIINFDSDNIEFPDWCTQDRLLSVRCIKD